MKLNFRLQSEQTAVSDVPVVLIHGLFGNLDNLGVLARDLKKDRRVIQLDVRNHGLSPRSDEISYAAMAQDVLETLDDLSVGQVDIIGRSMGGKIAMTLASLAPTRVRQLVVIDIAPVAYRERHHDVIFAALAAVSEAGITQRHDAAALMRQTVDEEGVIQFLLKSFQAGEWRFNVSALWQNYDRIIGWETLPAWPHPTLFIRGEHSP
ncbi:MAG TPA: esterase, partial [Erwinia sp.]|nr:esterase [Erwinia sp.]